MAQLNSTTISGNLGISAPVTGTMQVSGQVELIASGTGSQPIIVSAYAGQTVDLQQFKDSAGNIMLLVNSGGDISGAAGASAIIENISAATFSNLPNWALTSAGANISAADYTLSAGTISAGTFQNLPNWALTPATTAVTAANVIISGQNPHLLQVTGSTNALLLGPLTGTNSGSPLILTYNGIWNNDPAIDVAFTNYNHGIWIYGGDIPPTGQVNAIVGNAFVVMQEDWSTEVAAITSAGDVSAQGYISATGDITTDGELTTSGGVINFPSGWTIEYNDSASSLDFVYTSG